MPFHKKSALKSEELCLLMRNKKRGRKELKHNHGDREAKERHIHYSNADEYANEA